LTLRRIECPAVSASDSEEYFKFAVCFSRSVRFFALFGSGGVGVDVDVAWFIGLLLIGTSLELLAEPDTSALDIAEARAASCAADELLFDFDERSARVFR
jgi:hypothetical protein